MNIEKIAAKDAKEWAAAELFFGEGAGTRRKLLAADIGYKTENVSEYYPAFKKAYDKQNFSQLAMKAAKERKNIDRANMLGKNAKALLRGDRRSMSTGVLIIFVAGYMAHQTGYDKVILKEGKKYYMKARKESLKQYKKFKSDAALRRYQNNYNKSQKAQNT